MNVLITGVSGLLGAHIAAGFAKEHHVIGVDRNAWWGDSPITFLQGELNNVPLRTQAITSTAPDVLIHCAGAVDVDACERDPDWAHQVNVNLTRSLVAETPTDCLFVYISTDSVFCGDKAFWSEQDAPAPCNVYAATKLDGEREVAQLHNHLIVRTNFYGWSSGRKKTSAEWLYGALASGDSITLFDDFFFTPIYLPHLVRFLRASIDHRTRGLLHMAGRDRISKYEFGQTMAKLMSVSMKNVRRGSIEDAHFAATRSKDISLNTDRVQKLLGCEMPACEEGLQLFLADRGKPLSQR